jgi:hypothetical protein
VAQSVPHEMLLLDLYSALGPIDAINGVTATDGSFHIFFDILYREVAYGTITDWTTAG